MNGHRHITTGSCCRAQGTLICTLKSRKLLRDQVIQDTSVSSGIFVDHFLLLTFFLQNKLSTAMRIFAHYNLTAFQQPQSNNKRHNDDAIQQLQTQAQFHWKSGNGIESLGR